MDPYYVLGGPTSKGKCGRHHFPSLEPKRYNNKHNNHEKRKNGIGSSQVVGHFKKQKSQVVGNPPLLYVHLEE
jgi:hypothetical protein